MLFAICDNQDISVADALHQHSLHVCFRRSLDQDGMRQWGEMEGMMAQVLLRTGQDKVSWHLEQAGTYSVKSMYAKLSHMWEAKVPLKIKIFSWQLVLDKLPSGQQILTRHGPLNGLCALCGAPEDTNHIFFSFSLASFTWSVTRQLLGCNWRPANFAQFHAILSSFSGYSRRLLWVLFLVNLGPCGIRAINWLLKRKLSLTQLTLFTNPSYFCSCGA
jgi:hypothetical protein